MKSKIIAIDPSGNFINGKGGTGLFALYEQNDKVLYDEATIWAKDFANKHAYYKKIMETISKMIGQDKNVTLVVIEDFRLQSGKASKMSNQAMETSELIGIIESALERSQIASKRQQNTIKARWKTPEIIKEYMNMLGIDDFKLSSRHAKDALRHALHAWYFTRHKEG